MVSENTPIRTSAGAAATAIVAVVYGLGVAFLDLGPTGNQWWLMIGAAVVGILFVVFMVIPFARRLGQGPR